MRSTSRCAVRLCLTLLASQPTLPGAALSLGEARCFRFFFKIIFFFPMSRGSVHVRSTFEISESPFFFVCHSFFHFSFRLASCVCFHNRLAPRPDVLYLVCIYMHTGCCCCRCCCCCCSVPVLLLQQLLLFVIVCRMAKNVAGSLNLVPSSVFFLFIQTRIWHHCG